MRQGLLDLTIASAYLLIVWAGWRTWKFLFARPEVRAGSAVRVHGADSRPAASRPASPTYVGADRNP